MALRYLAGELRASAAGDGARQRSVPSAARLGPGALAESRHFFGVSAQMMRRVLVDIARRRRAERRGGAGAVRVPLDERRRRRPRA